MSRIYTTADQLIGGTPILEVSHIEEEEKLQAKVLVTKRSGAAGGFDQKVRAARECGIELVVVERPREERGLLLEEAQALLEERYGL